ncbi:MAG: hypothetical protein HY788_04300 [Deltaproteobacteria bacterium]|nr:hypothetical protein [Deltaproteobacteria bacterium]
MAVSQGKFEDIRLEEFLPMDLKRLANPQMDLPRIAKDKRLASDIEFAIRAWVIRCIETDRRSKPAPECFQ